MSQLELVGLVEIAERCGVARQTARQWRHRGLLPEPGWMVSGAPIWEWRTIEEWARSSGRVSEDHPPPSWRAGPHKERA
jgi:predicted site-specific integrase-resolvase